MGILIGVLVVAVLALGWWALSGSSFGRHMTDDQDDTREKRRVPPWAQGLIIAAVLFGIGIIVLQALGFGDDPVLGDAVATLDAL